ncbi:MAG: Crp/Fnr family transcriptional regulator [Planctomycetota bacterium]
MFCGICDSDLRALARAGRLVRAGAGEALWPASRRGTGLIALLDGWAKLQATAPCGEGALLRILRRGDLAGPPLTDAEGDPSLSLLALEPCEAVTWNREAWARAQRGCPQVAWNLIEAQTEYIRELQRRCVELAAVRVEARLARVVLRLAREAGRRTARGIEIRMPLSREDLAGLVGATIHTISRTLGEWERAGWVVAGWKRIVVVDAASLRGIVEAIETE